MNGGRGFQHMGDGTIETSIESFEYHAENSPKVFDLSQTARVVVDNTKQVL